MKRRSNKKKKRYKKPAILFREDKRLFVVGVSCQKVFGEADSCQMEIEI